MENGHLQGRRVSSLAQATTEQLGTQGRHSSQQGSESMILRLLHSRQLVASFLAAATGMALYFRAPFPETNLFLQVMAVRSAAAFLFFKYSYTLFLYTTPFIGFSILFSGIYIFALKARARTRAGKLPPYPEPGKRAELSLVLGEVHEARKQIPSEHPHWLTIPERGLF